MRELAAGIWPELYEEEYDMNFTTRAGRIATAQQLRAALHRAPGDTRPNDSAGPIGDCGRDASEPCGMKDENECRTHCSPTTDDPALLSYAGTRAQAREQLRAARRYGLC
jgi:hypothetical protein